MFCHAETFFFSCSIIIFNSFEHPLETDLLLSLSPFASFSDIQWGNQITLELFSISLSETWINTPLLGPQRANMVELNIQLLHWELVLNYMCFTLSSHFPPERRWLFFFLFFQLPPSSVFLTENKLSMSDPAVTTISFKGSHALSLNLTTSPFLPKTDFLQQCMHCPSDLLFRCYPEASHLIVHQGNFAQTITGESSIIVAWCICSAYVLVCKGMHSHMWFLTAPKHHYNSQDPRGSLLQFTVVFCSPMRDSCYYLRLSLMSLLVSFPSFESSSTKTP